MYLNVRAAAFVRSYVHARIITSVLRPILRKKKTNKLRSNSTSSVTFSPARRRSHDRPFS